MQRPTRIVVFAILCLVVGLFSGLSNGGELLMAAIGPSFMKSTQSDAMMDKMPEAVRESNQASETALGKPAYRIGLGVEAGLSLAMAGVLIVAGVGLLMDKLWALRLTRVWAFYALVASAFSVVLITRYVTPETPSVAPGSQIMGALCMLPMLWLFPVLLLTMLGRPAVREYLRWRAGQPRGGAPMQPADAAPPQAVPERPAPRPTTRTDPPGRDDPAPVRETRGTDRDPSGDDQSPPGHDTWRDDPWNDPTSR